MSFKALASTMGAEADSDMTERLSDSGCFGRSTTRSGFSTGGETDSASCLEWKVRSPE